MRKGHVLGRWPIRWGLVPVIVPTQQGPGLHGLDPPTVASWVVTAGTKTAFGDSVISTTVHVPRRRVAELGEVEAINLTGDSQQARAVRWNEQVIRLDGRRTTVLHASHDRRHALVGRRRAFSFSIVGESIDIADLDYATTRNVEGWLDVQGFFRALGR